MRSPLWADEKGSLIYKAIGTLIQAEIFALNDNATAALQSNIYGLNALRSDETNAFFTEVLVMVGENLRETWPIR